MVDSSSYFIWRPFNISLSPTRELSKLAGVRLPWRELPSPMPRRLLGWYLGELELLSELEPAHTHSGIFGQTFKFDF